MKKFLLIWLALLPVLPAQAGYTTLKEAAEKTGISLWALREAREIEKNFVLALFTGREGEHEIGRWPYGKSSDRTVVFHLDISGCKTQACRNKYDEAWDSAEAFALKYNRLIGTEAVRVSASGAGIPIYIADSFSFSTAARWNCCKGLVFSGRWQHCAIRISTEKSGRRFHHLVAHEMLNIMGPQDTQQDAFIGCASYDQPGASGLKNNFSGLCEAEKKAILFAERHLQPGMREWAVGYAFEAHWQVYDFTIERAKHLAARRRFCARTPQPPSCAIEAAEKIRLSRPNQRNFPRTGSR